MLQPLAFSLQPLTYPARPVNGGHLDHALPKVGAWSYEPKYNGWRAIVHVTTGTMWNRHGRRLTIAAEFSTALALLKRSGFEWLDVEALERRHDLGRGSLIILDCPGLNLPYESRVNLLQRNIAGAGLGICLAHVQKPKDNAVYLPPVHSLSDLDDLWMQLQDVNRAFDCPFYEGVVAKRNDSLYPIQLNNPDQATPTWMKHRFLK